jgi:hypothetical protein
MNVAYDCGAIEGSANGTAACSALTGATGTGDVPRLGSGTGGLPSGRGETDGAGDGAGTADAPSPAPPNAAHAATITTRPAMDRRTIMPPQA